VSARVRDQLVDLGLVAGDGGVPLGRDDNIAGVGDIVTCRRNDYRLGVTNRVQYRVLAAGAGEDGQWITRIGISPAQGPISMAK
jgi:hypothetical protein